MAKSRIGHFGEAQILEALGVDMIDESEGRFFKASLNPFYPCVPEMDFSIF